MFDWLQKRRDRFGQRELAPAVLAALSLTIFIVYDCAFDLIDGPVTCGFHALTGLPCPGCGLTRSVVALGNGELQTSIVHHPLGIAIVALLMVIVASWVLSCARNRPSRAILTTRVVTLFGIGFTGLWIARLLYALKP